MSKLDELLAQLCPNGVEYKRIGDIATLIIRGSGIKRTEVTEEGIPCVRYGEIYTTYNLWFDECVSHTDMSFVSAPKYFEYGDILFAITGESVEEIAKSIAYVGNDKCLAGGDIVVLKHNQNPKYLSYALSTSFSQNQKSKGRVKSKVVHSSVPAIKEIVVPIPPLEVQTEIVRILDNFTELTAELTAELAARKQQYDYYSEYLFDGVSQRVKTCQLREVVLSLKTGLNPRKNFKLNEPGSSIPYITGKDIYDNRINVTDKTDLITNEALMLINKRAQMSAGVLLFASTGTGTVGRMTVVDSYSNEWGMSETLYGIKADSNRILPYYLMYFLYSPFARNQFEPKISKGSVPHLKVKDLLDVRIPIPSLPEQEVLVELLKQFDSVCNDLTFGLPAEIGARQKQYEYYRDKLLSFPELKQ